MSAKAGIAAAQAFVNAFNAQDHEWLAATLHFPHVRLARDFTRIETAEDFIERSRAGAARLAEEGWHHTEIAAIEAVHVGPEKVHLAMTMHRCREDGTVYNAFDTLWIATLKGARWGIEFRSSYLAPAPPQAEVRTPK